MAISNKIRAFAFAALILSAAGPCARAAKTSQPVLRIDITALGYLPPPPHSLTPGGTMFTLNYVDTTHLLVTFNSRGLIPRDPNDPPGDEDRTVTALLLELPSGNILARTLWHLHDHGQYLWPLVNGRFLLRTRGNLTVIAPLAHLASDAPFKQQPYLTTNLQIGFIAISPGADLLTVETRPRRPTPFATATANAAAMNAVNMANGPLTKPVLQDTPDPDPPSDDISIVFYRLRTTPEAGNPDAYLPPPVRAGAFRYHAFVSPAVTSEGFLDTPKESSHTYLFDFYTHSGVKSELAPFDTTCSPAGFFVSRSEFIGYGCRGGQDRNRMGGFNLKGEHMWIQDLATGVQLPYLALAPDAGRFGLSRMLTNAPMPGAATTLTDEAGTQEITVTQVATGDNLLKLQTTPAQRSGQNFDLSPDGLGLAVLHDANIEIYRLPALTKKDEAAIAQAKAQAPPVETASVRLTHNHEPMVDAGTPIVDPNAPIRIKTLPDLENLKIGAPPPAPEPTTTQVGDTPRRTVPTLYGPGEGPQK
jgi:hypothetical protein